MQRFVLNFFYSLIILISISDVLGRVKNHMPLFTIDNKDAIRITLEDSSNATVSR